MSSRLKTAITLPDLICLHFMLVGDIRPRLAELWRRRRRDLNLRPNFILSSVL